MFWYTIIRTDMWQSLIDRYNIIFDKWVACWNKLTEAHRELRIKQQKIIEDLAKDIPHWGYLTAPISNKNRSDAFIKKEALKYLPVEYNEDMIEDFLIDRKQGKMVILMK